MIRTGIYRHIKPQLVFHRSLSQYRHNPQIYIHEVIPNIYKFSLSSDPHALAIGVAPTESPTPDTFQANSKFLDLVNKTIKDNIEQDFTFIMEAGVNRSSFMPIYDLREIPSYARIPEPENVFGYVRVDDDGKIVHNSYESNHMYRLCSGTSGLCKFSDHILEKLRAQLSE